MKITYWILAVLLALAFGSAGFLKLSANPIELEIFTRFEYPLWFMYVIGMAEFAGALGLVFGRIINEQFSRWAGIGLLSIMIGAIMSHLLHDPLLAVIPATVLSLLVLGFLYVDTKTRQAP